MLDAISELDTSILSYVQSSGEVLCLPLSGRWTVGQFGAVQAFIPSTEGPEKGSGMRLITAKICHSITFQTYEKLASTVQVSLFFQHHLKRVSFAVQILEVERGRAKL